MDEKTKNEIDEKMLELFERVSQSLDSETQKVAEIKYFKEMQYGESNLISNRNYIVVIENQAKQMGIDGEELETFMTYLIYDSDLNLNATVDKDNQLTFTEEYLERLRETNPQYYEMLELDDATFELPEVKEHDRELSRKQLEEKEKQKLSEKKQERDWDKEEKEACEEAGIEDIDKLRALAIIDPHKKITGNQTLAQIVPELAKYEEIQISCEKGDNLSDGRFTVIGKKPDGTKEITDAFEQAEGVNTGRNVTSINRDGTEVEDKEVKGLLTIPGRPEEGLSISVGQYNQADISFVQNMNDRENRQSIPIESEGRYDGYVYQRVREEGNTTEGMIEKDEEAERRTKMVKKNDGKINPQTIDGTDIDLKKIKKQIVNKALDKYEDLSSEQLRQYIKDLIDGENIQLSQDEEELLVNELKIRVEDEARAFPSRQMRSPNSNPYEN